MTYDLPRLRLKGLTFRPPKTNRYIVTRMDGKWRGYSRDWRHVCSVQQWQCSPPTTSFGRFRCAKPWIMSTRNSIVLSTTSFPCKKRAKNLTIS